VIDDVHLTADLVAARWRVHKTTVLRLFHTGVLPGIVLSRGKSRTTVRFKQSMIEAFEREREKGLENK